MDAAAARGLNHPRVRLGTRLACSCAVFIALAAKFMSTHTFKSNTRNGCHAIDMALNGTRMRNLGSESV